MSRENTQVRMIAVDMDGTLLGQDGRVSERNLAALRAAEAAGIEVVVATGRRHSYAMRVLRSLGLHHAAAVVSSNGTVTRTIGAEGVGSTLVARTLLPHATARAICAQLAEFRNALVLTFDLAGADGEDARGALVVEHLDELNASIGRWMQANEPYIAHVVPIEDALRDEAEAPIQMMLCGTVERMRRAEARLLELPGVAPSGASADDAAGGQITLHRTEYPERNLSILDILPAGCSKGVALLALAETRGYGAAEIMAIGDNWNDVSMLAMAGRPVLMANAPEDLKLVALERGWAIGSSNVEDGVAVAVEEALAALAVAAGL
jgi:hydroxymethylpyrimidine pyrophosphatase-like HAD family hydrolase